MNNGRTNYLRLIALGTLLVTGVNTSWVYAFGKADRNSFQKNLVITQEKYVGNGILISRPAPAAERIRDIIIDNDIRSLDDYLSWLQKNIKYRKDNNEDIWASPQETLQNGYGDCEDFAFLNEAVLTVCGYKPKVLSVMRIFRSHAICVFKENDQYSLIDNAKLIRTKSKSIPDLARFLFAKYNYRSLWALNLKAKDGEILFKAPVTKSGQ